MIGWQEEIIEVEDGGDGVDQAPGGGRIGDSNPNPLPKLEPVVWVNTDLCQQNNSCRSK